jgi:hypothetical protein
MKKLFITLALAAATFVGANAQFFVGGGLAFEYGKGKNLNGFNTNADGAAYGFEIAPIVGYNISDKFLVGLQFGVSVGKAEVGGLLNRYDFDEAVTVAFAAGSQKFLGWQVTPFARYNFAKVGNFTFSGQANIDLNGTKFDDSDVSTFGFGINIVPVVNYAFNEHWSIEGQLGFASIGYNFNKIDAGSPEDPTIHNFGFGVNQGKTIEVAAVYTF